MKTNAREYGTETVPATVQGTKPKHVEDMGEDVSKLSEMISSGRTFLKVVAYPWGVEFDVCDWEGQE